MKYRRDISYDAVVHADYARWGGKGRAARLTHWRVPAAAVCAAAVLVSLLTARSDKPDLAQSEADAPRERIGLRVTNTVGEQPERATARLPFEPRVPPAVSSAPKLLPESANQHANWATTQIRAGESLSRICERIGVSKEDAQRLIDSTRAKKLLNTINAGRTIAFRLEGGRLEELAYEVDLLNTILVQRTGDGYSSELVKLESEVKVAAASGEITRSLFLDGRAAGLSDRLIMEFTEIFGWDVDFVLDLRRGDRFKVVYEEVYRGGDKVSNGRILGAEFTNRGRTLRALFYEAPDGTEGYYAENGQGMRKAFLRAPLNFTRISSRFNLARKHPILNRIRAHRGVDYSAPMGTPVRAVANGKVEFAGTQGGYGNVIVLRHGDSYSTLYGHLSKFAKRMARGTAVQQGQLIGYVGKSGLATGPHLHYEFRINNVHHDPLTVKLPRAVSLEKRELAQFRAQAAPTVALLNSVDENGGEDTMVANASRERIRAQAKDM